MRVEPKTLVRRLTSTATRSLEGGVSRASSARSYEIVPEHMVRQLLEDEEGEASLILRHFQVDRTKVLARVEDTLRGLRSGNAGRPVFSESLFQWFEDAWLLASLEHGALRLRSGALMAQWIARSAKYSAESYPELDAISTEGLKKAFEDIVSVSKEASEVAAAGSAPAPAGGAAAPRGEDALSRFKTHVRRLTSTATRSLEGGVSRSVSARSYEIVPEHMLRELLEDEEGEASLILRHFQVDRTKVLSRVEDTLRGLRSGNAGRPVFSESLFQWFEDAWLLASLEHGALRLRSGALMAQWIARSAKYSAESYPELDAISTEGLKKAFEDIVSVSKEASEVAAAGSAPAPAGGAAAPRGEDALSRFTTSFTTKAREWSRFLCRRGAGPR